MHVLLLTLACGPEVPPASDPVAPAATAGRTVPEGLEEMRAALRR